MYWQIQRGASIPTWRKPRNCPDARYLATVWAERSYRSRQETALYREKIRERLLRDFEVGPDSHAWHRAVREVQKVYPGTEGWLLSCSASEGGHGRWVPNSQGSGVGGWMQMYPSTFWRMFTAARADVTARGYRVPSSAASWFSPLGQALGSAWGVTHGRKGEWAGFGCQ